MAKGLRSNRQKALRTERRLRVMNSTSWVAKAEEARQQALAKCAAAPSAEIILTEAADDGRGPENMSEKSGMDVDSKAGMKGGKRYKKAKRGVSKKTGKKYSILCGKANFHKKHKAKK